MCDRPRCRCGGQDREPFTYRFAKGVLDVSVALVALVALAPLLVALAGVVRATSPGPALFRQERVGRHEQRFVMYKFRTMRADADDAAHRDYASQLLSAQPPAADEEASHKLQGDPRVTRVGAFLRRAGLDELPQLLNVLQGHMSLIGPRPALPWEVGLYRPEHCRRFAVKPGMTGVWQVSGRAVLPMSDALDLDVDYVRRRWLGLDLRMLAKTTWLVVRAAVPR